LITNFKIAVGWTTVQDAKIIRLFVKNLRHKAEPFYEKGWEEKS
jgi:hypothetical protein